MLKMAKEPWVPIFPVLCFIITPRLSIIVHYKQPLVYSDAWGVNEKRSTVTSWLRWGKENHKREENRNLDQEMVKNSFLALG